MIETNSLRMILGQGLVVAMSGAAIGLALSFMS